MSEGHLNRESLRDASTVRLDKVSRILILRETLARQDGSPEELYSREGNA
jgi:hypothetical protein